MLVKENVETISILIDKLFTFVRTDEEIQEDLVEYMNSLSEKVNSESELQAVLIPYVFDKKLENDKKVINYFIEKNPDLTSEEKNVLAGLNRSISSVFEIKRIMKNGFQLYNLVNEKSYEVLTLVKMVNFRGITQGQYLIGRIIPHENDNYLIEINNILPARSKQDAYKLAVTKQLDQPELLYCENEEKLAEIQKNVENLGLKFVDFFKRDEIITTTNYVDELLGEYNDFVENDIPSIKDINHLIHLPEKFAYFEVKEVKDGISDFGEAAAKGFSGHEKIYDVGLVFDLDLGLLVLPFYGTFKEIFKSEDYKSIEGYKECILNYFNSNKVPPTPILRVYNENREKFLDIITEVLELDNKPDIQELLHKYKKDYCSQKRFSSPTVLYSSKAFSELMGFAEEKPELAAALSAKIGRNDLCPCGSGKKFKKCCLK